MGSDTTPLPGAPRGDDRIWVDDQITVTNHHPAVHSARSGVLWFSGHRLLCAVARTLIITIGPFDVQFGLKCRSDSASSVLGQFGPRSFRSFFEDRNDWGPKWPRTEVTVHRHLLRAESLRGRTVCMDLGL